MEPQQPKDTLGDRMKGYEAALDYAMTSDSLYVIRLDGRGFSKFTRRIKAVKPYDQDFMDIMEKVCSELLMHFHFATVYTQSDEITCVPYFFGDNRESYFGLRLQKLCSVIAAYATASFIRHYLAVCQVRGEFFTEMYPTFDCRVFSVPTKEEILNSLIWRQRDCEKNAKNNIAQSCIPHKQLLHKNSDEQVALAEMVTGKTYESYSPYFRHGIFIKKSLQEVEGFNPKMQRTEKSMRGVVEKFTRSLHFCDKDLAQMLSKYTDPSISG